MGREIRRVPPNWAHPKKLVPNHRLGRMEEDYQPLYDRTFEDAMKSWLEELQAWLDGGFDEQRREQSTRYPADEPYRSFCDWHGTAPDPEYHRPVWREEPTWVQVYETVSEGTPVTPPFATAEELVNYLVEKGDFWDQKRGDGGWKRDNAESFVKRGWSMR